MPGVSLEPRYLHMIPCYTSMTQCYALLHTVLHTSYHTPLPVVLALTYTARSATQHVGTHVPYVEERDASYPRSREYL